MTKVDKGAATLSQTQLAKWL